MRLAVYTVCLPDLAPERVIAEARSAGYDGIEWRVAEPVRSPADPSFFGRNLATVAPTPEGVVTAVRATEAAGLQAVGLGTYVDSGDEPALRAALGLASAAGVGWVRMRAPWRDRGAHETLFDAARRFLATTAELAAQSGVRVLIEMHQRTICPSASAAARLLAGLDPHHVAVIYDAGNLVVEGYEGHRMAVEVLGERLAHVHVKNAAWERPPGGGVWTHRWSPLDDGVLDVDDLLDTLAAAGYAGWVSVEDFCTDRSPVETLRHDARILRRHPALRAVPVGSPR